MHPNMAFVIFGCRPARDHPDVRGTSGSGHVRLVSECGLFRAYLGSFVTLVVCRSDIIWMSRLPDLLFFGMVVQSSYCMNSHIVMKKKENSCRDCASSLTKWIVERLSTSNG